VREPGRGAGVNEETRHRPKSDDTNDEKQSGIIGQQVYLSCARCNAKRAGLRLLAGASSSAHQSVFASDGSVAMNNPATGRVIYRRNQAADIARRCVGAGRALT